MALTAVHESFVAETSPGGIVEKTGLFWTEVASTGAELHVVAAKQNVLPEPHGFKKLEACRSSVSGEPKSYKELCNLANWYHPMQPGAGPAPRATGRSGVCCAKSLKLLGHLPASKRYIGQSSTKIFHQPLGPVWQVELVESSCFVDDIGVVMLEGLKLATNT